MAPADPNTSRAGEVVWVDLITNEAGKSQQFMSDLLGWKYEKKGNYALAKVGLYGYEDMPGYQLSAGQLRRVALARLYLSQVPVWILDEPYTAVDKQGIANLEAVFKDHVDRGGLVIFTSHQTPNLPNLKCVNLLNFAPGAIREVAGG